jgi:protein arginine N-methyltransferase 2
MDSRKYTYEDNNLYNSKGEAVMMEWERDWMKYSADIVCKNGGDILNIGHGLGIVDSYIQEHNPKSHTIIEIHSDVHKFMYENGWYETAKVIESDWKLALSNLPTFDGIYFDTWADNPHDFRNGLIRRLPYLLNKGGIFSYWVNLNVRDIDMVELCESIGLEIRYERFDINVPEKQYKNKNKTYINSDLKFVMLPIITNPNEPLPKVNDCI